MILLTVGTQLPFDRLVRAVDSIALQLEESIFGQIGEGNYVPKNFEYCRLSTPSEMMELFQSATRIVSHAGTGSLLTARRFGKPIVIFPRRAAFGEHRNDHQLATCEHVGSKAGVEVAYDEAELHRILEALRPPEMHGPVDEERNSQLGGNIYNYIKHGRVL